MRTAAMVSRTSRWLVCGACVVAAFAGGACATALGGGGRTGARAAEPSTHDVPYAAVEQLGRVLVEVENEYVDPVDRAKLVDGAIKGMVAELDPHSSYMPPDDFAAFESDTEGQFGGVGVEVEEKDEQLVVLAPIEGSPADRAGIRAGDVVVGVNGRDPTSVPLEKLVKQLRGPAGSHVKIAIRRRGAPEVLSFDVVREVIRVPSVASKLLVGNVAYLRLKQFQERTHDELLDAVAKLRGRAAPGHIAGIVLDMRANPGGLVDQAAAVADELLDAGIIYTTRHRGQVVEEITAHKGGALVAPPCVVLVNQYTASASELVAGALQDQKRALVVGEPTFGKGSVQAIISLPGGAGMRLTVSRYYTPSGHAIQADGVHPDVTVEPRSRPDDPTSYREKDLEGHLAAESPGVAGSTRDAGSTVIVETDGGPEPPVPSGSEAHVPDDPETGGDAILKVGWQVLHRAMAGAR